MKQIKKIANRCMLYNNTDEFCLFSNTRSSYILCMDSLAVIDTNVKDVRYYLFDSKICYMSASENEFYKFNIEKEELLFLGWSKPLSYGMGYELINLAEFVIGISESYSKKMILINKKTNEIISSENCPPKYSISKGCKYDEETLFIMMISPVSWRLLNRYFKVKMNDIDYYEEIELNMEEQVWDKCFYLKSKKYFMFIEDNRFYIYSEIEKKMIYYSPNFENSFISLTHFLDENTAKI